MVIREEFCLINKAKKPVIKKMIYLKIILEISNTFK